MPNGVILVVDDNPTNLKLTKLLLRANDYEVHTATDGPQALQTLEVLRPDLILMDVNLPGMDGLEATRRIRSNPATADISIVAVTGDTTKGAEERARAAGCDGYIPKPIDIRAFPSLVGNFLEPGKANLQATGNRIVQVLIADDDPIGRTLLQMRLERAGYSVRSVASGEAALDAARRETPDLVVSDIAMPGMDGFRLCQSIRTTDTLCGTHVILTSSAGIEESADRLAREMGATACVKRTADLAGILDAIRQASKLQPPAVQRVGAEDLEPLIRAFVNEGCDRLAQLIEAEKGGTDIEVTRGLAHRWAGTGGSLGFPEISKQAFELESHLLQEAPDRAVIGQSLRQLAKLFSEAKSGLEDERTLVDSVEHPLGGKRLAVVGISGTDADRIARTLALVGALVETLDRAPADTSGFDLIVAEAGSAKGLDRSSSAPPTLIVGSPDRLAAVVRSPHRDFLVSPVEADEFVLRCAHLIGRAAGSARPAAVTAGNTADRILIVDDDPAIIGLITRALERASIASDHATSGDEGLEKARQLSPSVIILDVNMPNMNGFEVLEALRRDPRTRSIRVVLLTARNQEADVLRGFQLGVDDYVRKPFNTSELLARLQRLTAPTV
jgi:CheY-like chemotaxis protein